MDTHRNVFEWIYLKDLWGGSGVGSSPKFCKLWCDFMEEFLLQNNIKSVLDIGCGYREYSEYKDWAKPLNVYHGVDLARMPIDACRTRFSEMSNYKFSIGDGFDFIMEHDFDLLLIKDVFNHLPLENIRHCLHRVSGHRCVMLIHDFIPHLPNTEIAPGDSRPIDPTLFHVQKPYLVYFWRSKGVWIMSSDIRIGKPVRLLRRTVIGDHNHMA